MRPKRLRGQEKEKRKKLTAIDKNIRGRIEKKEIRKGSRSRKKDK